MKQLKSTIAITILTFFVACTPANIKESSFKVWGNCNMCKETIESSLQTNGIQSAEWNVDNKIIQVRFDTTKIKLDAIQQLIANAGYDNDKYKGKDSIYSQLPECCQYVRK